MTVSKSNFCGMIVAETENGLMRIEASGGMSVTLMWDGSAYLGEAS